MMTVSRRTLLKSLGATGCVAPFVASAPAIAANISGYKALVCVFLYGGLDGHDVLLPYDAGSYSAFARVRQTLLNQQPNRRRDALEPLSLVNQDQFGARRFALAPEMPNIANLINRGEASLVSNVGPLIEPTTRADFDAKSVQLPPRLFSHNDQQSVWQSGGAEGASFGWGGLFADAALASGANPMRENFTSITLGNGLFLSGELANPFRISDEGAVSISLLDYFAENEESRDWIYDQLRSQFGGQAYSEPSLIGRDVARILESGLSNGEAYTQARANAPALSTSFPEGALGRQLKAVAETIAIRQTLGVSRQVFFVGIGGFDTHDAQASTLPRLLAEIDASIAAFQASMSRQGLDRDVTLFTASDFGRTLAVNGDGTDHGWGGHHLIVGGAIRGGHIFGDVPPAGLGHAQDSGQGRLIPTLSVEQYAQPLGSWFGLSAPELDRALPNLQNFSSVPRLMA